MPQLGDEPGLGWVAARRMVQPKRSGASHRTPNHGGSPDFAESRAMFCSGSLWRERVTNQGVGKIEENVEM